MIIKDRKINIMVISATKKKLKGNMEITWMIVCRGVPQQKPE